MKRAQFDVIIWGASGFTGHLVADYLASAYGVGDSLNWAIAGRNQRKLESVRAGLSLPDPQQLPILLADSQDEASLAELVTQTRVICTTVGPYAHYGTPLVAACAESGTHYCDLTGELQWMARVIPQYQSTAQGSGARIVHCCGFDSIPSDIGTWFLQQAMIERHGVPADHVKMRLARMSGTASGGTVASILNIVEEAQRDPSIRKQVADPYCLYPAGVPAGPDGPDQRWAKYDRDFKKWTAPFVMAAINTRVVRRSNALMGFPWGEDFRYDEAVLTPSRLKAKGVALASGLGMAALALGPTRNIAKRFLPDPGEGPTPAQQEAGFFEILFHGAHPEEPGLDLRARVCGDRDPGYGSTAKMLGESAVCLALDKAATGGGFWTPASAMAEELLPRLTQKAGLSFEIIDDD